MIFTITRVADDLYFSGVDQRYQRGLSGLVLKAWGTSPMLTGLVVGVYQLVLILLLLGRFINGFCFPCLQRWSLIL